MRILMKLLILAIFCVFAFLLFVWSLEKKSVFYPARKISATPHDAGLEFEDLTITTFDNVKLNGWLIPAPSATAIVIFLHGNAGNIGDRLGKIDMFHKLGVNTLIIDYRGYGKSEGRPSENGVYADALAAYDYIKSRPDLTEQKIVAFGASLGGAVAVDLAARRKLDGVIIDSSFSSAADMAKTIYPFIPTILIKTKLDSSSKIGRIKIPKLFFHSPEDDVVPFVLGDKLYQQAAPPKKFVTISGGHNDGHINSYDIMMGAIRAFLKENALQ